MQTYGIGLQRQAKGGQPGGARQPGGSLLGSLSDSAASLASAPAGGARVSPNLSAAGPALPVASFSVEPVRGLATGGGADAKDQTLAIQGPVPYGGGPAGPAAYAAAVADARQAASGWKPSTGLGLERMPAQARPLGDWEAALAASVAARAPNPGRGQTAARGGAALPPEAKTKSPAPGARRLLAVAARGAEDSETAAGQPGSGSGVAGVHTGGAKVKLAVKVRRDERADPARTGLGPAAAEGAREAALEYARVRDAHGVAARGSAEGRPAADGQQEARGVAAAAGPTGFGFDVAGEGGGGLRSARLAVAAPGALARSGAVDALLAAVAPLAAHARSRVAQRKLAGEAEHGRLVWGGSPGGCEGAPAGSTAAAGGAQAGGRPAAGAGPLAEPDARPAAVEGAREAIAIGDVAGGPARGAAAFAGADIGAQRALAIAALAALCISCLAAAALHAALRRLLRQPERGEAWQQQCVTLLQHTTGAELGAA